MRRIQGRMEAPERFHGGLSLRSWSSRSSRSDQEALLNPAHMARSSGELVAGSRKLSTRFFSVQIRGRAESLLAIDPPRVRVEDQGRDTDPVGACVGSLWFRRGYRNGKLRTADGEAKPLILTRLRAHSKEPVTDSVTGSLA